MANNNNNYITTTGDMPNRMLIVSELTHDRSDMINMCPFVETKNMNY